MNLELFIAKRLVSDKESKGSVSRSLVKITTFGISLGLSVMIISVAVVTGFKKEITNKVIGFGGDLQIENLDNNSSYETKPISSKQNFIDDIKKLPLVRNVQPFGIQSGILKTKSEVQGIVLKGVDQDYDWSFFKKNLKEGKLPTIKGQETSNELLISSRIADLLNLKVNQDIALFFIVDQQVFMRRMKLTGIYETGLEEFDKLFAVGDIKHIRKVRKWEPDQITGFEINITDFKELNNAKTQVNNIMGINIQEDGSGLRLTSIVDKNPQMFDWLNLQNLNVWIILILMLVVAGFNMISGLLILILDRTKMIGLLTSMGAQSVNIRKIFLYQSGFLVLRGLLWGNIIGLGICFIQYFFKVVKLEQSSYFISSVPININVIHIFLLNAGTLASIMLMLLIPSIIISKINPDVTLRYD
ncbi:MAG TPA: FtsX-like permease family protein [Bacteroidales bacterium]|nr:FtsX-like permease family protein [Bacteroidales bacterium]